MTPRVPVSLAEGPAALPRGPHDLSPEEVVASQRGRILQAIAEVVADKGYTAATVGDVTARARVSRQVFYALFADKEDCFLAAYRRAAEQHLRLVMAAGGREHHWLDRHRAALRAYLDAFVVTPWLARSFMIEVHAAGPRVAEYRRAVLRRYVGLFRDTHDRIRAELPDLPRVSDTVLLAIVAGGDELATSAVRAGATESLPELFDEILFLHLSVLVGPGFAAATAA